jgi:hypothetical protein
VRCARRSAAGRRLAVWWAFVRAGFRGTLPAFAVILLIAGVVCLHSWDAARTSLDLRGVEPDRSQGMVTQVAFQPVTESNQDPYRLAWLSVDDQPLVLSLWASPVVHGPGIPLRKGQPVRITYRIGRSGRWYLDRVESLKR